jgi:hypothetical protein
MGTQATGLPMVNLFVAVVTKWVILLRIAGPTFPMLRIPKLVAKETLRQVSETPMIETNLGKDLPGTRQEDTTMTAHSKTRGIITLRPEKSTLQDPTEEILLLLLPLLPMDRPPDGTSSTRVLWQKQK